MELNPHLLLNATMIKIILYFDFHFLFTYFTPLIILIIDFTFNFVFKFYFLSYFDFSLARGCLAFLSNYLLESSITLKEQSNSM